jgi:hypothetical protein
MAGELKVKCHAVSKQTGKQCQKWAIKGGTVCRWHGGGSPQVRAKANVRAEIDAWGLTDVHEDPGEVLLRLVTQSAARVRLYSRLLQEAYDAAERLQKSQVGDLESNAIDRAGGSQHALEDLDRIFNTGGISALIGHTWGAVKDVGVYATGEAIRGLADLEMKERKLCAEFATKAIAAGLAERQVRLAEAQGELFAQGVRLIVERLNLSEEQAALLPVAMEAAVLELTG